ncbi:MAG: PAS domain S-box protein [Bacteroidales bacterium]|nr:PAS domain S-box protein [Bacteroidales bacterium]MDY0348107.1 PAS domain S-box protein [Tenuifilaceae bacterium]
MPKAYPQNISSLITLLPSCTMVWQVEKQSVIVFNRSLFSELGYPPKQDIIDTWQQLIHPDDEHNFNTLKNLEKPVVFEARLRQPSGGWTWYSISANTFTSSAKEPCHEVIITFTPIKQASKLQRSLYESNERFKSLAEASFGGIAIHDKGRIVEANLALAQMTGYSHTELIGFDGLLLIQEQQRPLVIKNIAKNFDKPYRSVGVRKDGTTYPLEIRGKQVPYKGRMMRVAEFRNIEDSVRYEQAIKQSEQKYRDTIEFAVDGFVIGDSNGKIISTNKRFLEIVGREGEKVDGVYFTEFFSVKMLEDKPLLLDALDRGETVVSEREIIKPNGEVVYIEMHSKKMPDDTYQAIVRDVTERKKEQAEIEVSEARHRAIFSHASDAILIMGQDGVIDCNPKAEELFGYSREELLGQKPESFSPEFQLNGQLSKKQASLYTAKALAGESQYFEWIHIHADGTPVFTEISLSPLYLHNQVYVQLIIRDITERKEWQEKHRETEERLRYVIEVTNDGIWDYDVEKQKLFFSNRYYTMLGYEPNEFEATPESWENLLHPDDREYSKIVLSKYLKENVGEFNVEFRFRTKDNRWRWINSRGKVVERNQNGESKRIVGTHMDITERKLMEMEINQAKNLLRLVLDTIPVRVFWKDKNLKLLGCNMPFALDAGVKNPNDIIGLTDYEMSWKNEAPKYIADDREVMETGRAKINFEETQTTPNGELVWLKTSKIPLRDAEGNIIGVLGTYDDITETKKAREAVELEKAYFEQLFEASPEGIAIVDSNDCVVRCNAEFIELFGYLSDELKGKPINTFIVPENLKDEGQAITDAVAQGETVAKETIRKRKDGSLVHVSILGKPIYFKGGKVAVYAIYRDITARKRAEEELVNKNHEIEAQNEEYRVINEELYEAKKKAEESDRLKSAFLANMSHEIRTPMNGILGFSQLLTKPDTPQESIDEYVGIIKSCGNQLLGIINDLIDISKIEANQVTISSTEVNVNDMLHDQFMLFKERANEKGLELSYSSALPLDKALIITDEGRVKQILANLLSNAIKFTDQGHVKLGYSLDGNSLHFFVQDTGIGIAPKDFELIFERFSQVEDSLSKQLGGTGLGLPISKAYVDKLGGNIWVDSSVNSGATFHFTIPYQPVILGENESQSELQSDSESIPVGINMLIAEDDFVNFQYLKELLIDFDVNIIWAKNGADAVNEVKVNSDIDIVLMDIKMPVMDGYEATAEIRKFRSDLPIIAQTAYAFSSDREKALNAGCNDYISKPINRKQLIALIGKHVNG